jgi:VanZ family protein
LKRILIEKPRHGAMQKFKVTESKKIDRKWLLAGLFIITAIFSLLPDFHLDKLVGVKFAWWLDLFQHIGYYFLFTICLFILFPAQKRNFNFFFLTFCISLFFEFLQLLIPEVNISITDLAGNLIGISAAFLLFYYKLRKKAI